MKNLRKLIPALALVLGATLAMAMNFPNPGADNNATKIFTPDVSQPNGHRDVTSIVNLGDYECDQSSMDCLVEFSNDNPATGVPNVLATGRFVQL